MRVIYCLISFSLSLLITGCYEHQSTTTVLNQGDQWTGSGDYSNGYSFNGYAVGLAGQDMVLFDKSGFRARYSNVLFEEFSSDYELTSVAQTFSLGWHEQSFLHGNLVGRTDNLDIFHTQQAPFGNTARRIRPGANISINYAGNHFRVRQICDMATADPSFGWVLPYHSDSRLFMSVRACTSSNACVGGVIEAEINRNINQWNIRSTGSSVQHAQVRRPGGGYFSNECMPLAATRRSDNNPSSSDQEYLFMADPSADQLMVYDVLSLQSGAVDTVRNSSSDIIRDISAEGVKVGNNHFSLLQVLWQVGSSKRIKHYLVADGNLDSNNFLDEPVSSSVQFIQGLGNGYRNYLESEGHLITFGSTAQKRKYIED